MIIKILPWRDWVYRWKCKNYAGLFRNRKEVIPGRWGFFFLGLEIGNRNPGSRFGRWLKRVGLWPF